MKTFQIKGIRFKLGDRIALTWLNTSPKITSNGAISAYIPVRGKCCLQIEDGAWLNPRHPFVRVERGA